MERLEKYGSGALIRERLAAVQGVFPTLNVDMIFNLPGQTLAMLDHDLDVLQSLQRRPGVVLSADDRADRAPQDGEDDGSQRPVAAAPDVRAHPRPAARRPTIRPRPGASRATRACSTSTSSTRTTTSASAAARSATSAARYYSTTFSLNHYCRRVEGGQSGITQRRPVGLHERMRYDYLVRLFGGELRRDYIERRYGRAFWLLLAPELLAMRALGATRHDRDAIRLTHRGMYCWVLMMAEFFNSVNYGARADARAHPRRARGLERGSPGTRDGDRPARPRERVDIDDAGHTRVAGPRQRRALHARTDRRDLRAPPRQPAARHRLRRGAAALGRGRRASWCSPPTASPCSRSSFPAATSVRWRCTARPTTWPSPARSRRYLSLGVLLEEGLEFAVLERVVAGIARAAARSAWWWPPATPRSCGAAKAAAST